LTPLLARAAYYDSFPAQPGFTHPPVSPDDPGTGLPTGGGIIRRGSPTIAEIDGSSADGKEIVVGNNDGWLYVYHKNGSLAWKQNVLPSACTYQSGDGIINSAPAVGNIFGGSTPYVVVSYGTINTSTCDGGVVVFNGATGALRWRFSLRAWQASEGYPVEGLYGAVSSPALADTDADGQMEIGFGGFDRNVYLLNADGTVRWYYRAADTVWSSPVFVNLDDDPELELVIGTDISANSHLNPTTTNGGFVYAFDTQPRSPKRIDFNTGYKWRTPNLDQVIYSSPAIADLDGDGVKEIIIGSGCFFSPASLGHWIKILDSRNGNEIRQLNTAGCLSSSPAIGDIDGDGKLEIVAGVNGANNDPPTPAVLQAWEYNNPTPKWTIDPRDSLGNNDPNLDDIQSPVLADLDGNGSLEVIVANMADVSVFRGDTGAQLTCRSCLTGSGKSLFTLYSVKATPAVGDIDGDGDLEVVIGGGSKGGGSGYLYVWTNFSGLGSPAGSLPHYSAPWPMFHHDPLHTGALIQPKLRPSAPSLALMVQQGAPAQTISVALKDDAGGAIDWSATKDQPWISLNATNGTTPDTLNITIDPGNMGLGTYTGAVSLSSSVNSPTIDVTLIIVDQINRVYLPIGKR
jgi:hypothetical protein